MSDQPVIVTQQAMYELLQRIDGTLRTLVAEHDQHTRIIGDHEDRLRRVEAEGNITRRLDQQETDLEAVQRRVWAIPSAATVIAAAALIVTLIRTL